MHVLYSENTIKKQHPSNVLVLKRVSFDVTNFLLQPVHVIQYIDNHMPDATMSNLCILHISYKLSIEFYRVSILLASRLSKLHHAFDV